jgi:hypothetical protein
MMRIKGMNHKDSAICKISTITITIKITQKQTQTQTQTQTQNKSHTRADSKIEIANKSQLFNPKVKIRIILPPLFTREWNYIGLS